MNSDARLWMELALAFGIPVSLLQTVTPAREFELWKLFVRVFGPIGERRQDYRMAILTASQCAKEGDTVEKFLPKFTQQAPEETDEPDSFESTLEKTIRVASDIVKTCRGTVADGPLRTFQFKPGQLRRIKHHGENDRKPGR